MRISCINGEKRKYLGLAKIIFQVVVAGFSLFWFICICHNTTSSLYSSLEQVPVSLWNIWIIERFSYCMSFVGDFFLLLSSCVHCNHLSYRIEYFISGLYEVQIFRSPWWELVAYQWRHNERDGVSNHQPHDCLFNRLFRRRSKNTTMLRVTGLCVGISPVTGEFPTQMASNAENTQQ